MRLTFDWKWVLIALVAFAPMRMLRSYTDLPDAMIWALAGVTLVVLAFGKWALSLLDTPGRQEGEHVWEMAPQGWHCSRCDRTRWTDTPPPAEGCY